MGTLVTSLALIMDFSFDSNWGWLLWNFES